MIRIRRRGITYGELWFDEVPPSPARVDILEYSQRPEPPEGGTCSKFFSLVTDLTQPEDTLLAQVGPQTRYQIRRSATKDGVRGEFLREPRPRLAEFADFYDAFAEQKGVSALQRHALHAAAEAGQLVLTSAGCGEGPLVWHAYVVVGGTAGLLHTASQFRGKSTDQTRLIGRANRWLHWNDMLEFRAIGVKRYNWGGLFEDTSTAERAGINRFKEDFGGERVCTYNALVPLTAKGRAYLALREVWCRVRGAPRQAAASAA